MFVKTWILNVKGNIFNLTHKIKPVIITGFIVYSLISVLKFLHDGCQLNMISIHQ